MANKEVKYPQIVVELVGQDGNAFNIISLVRRALKKGGVSKQECDQFMEEAMNGDYDDLLVTCLRWVTVE